MDLYGVESIGSLKPLGGSEKICALSVVSNMHPSHASMEVKGQKCMGGEVEEEEG